MRLDQIAQEQLFVREQLRVMRSEFYRDRSDKQFYQERPRLVKAITYPAHWMNERGAVAPPALYRRIIGTVIAAIKQHGDRSKIERFEIYFWHCVQEHMRHHGEEYYYQAKEPLQISDLLQTSVGRMERKTGIVSGAGASATRQLAALHKSIKIGGRRRIQKGDSTASLFDRCKPPAQPRQGPG
jgi:hypothetical protein